MCRRRPPRDTSPLREDKATPAGLALVPEGLPKLAVLSPIVNLGEDSFTKVVLRGLWEAPDTFMDEGDEGVNVGMDVLMFLVLLNDCGDNELLALLPYVLLMTLVQIFGTRDMFHFWMCVFGDCCWSDQCLGRAAPSL